MSWILDRVQQMFVVTQSLDRRSEFKYKNAFQLDAYRPLVDRMLESASRGGVSAPGGVCSRGVSAPGGVVCSGGGYPSMY